MFRGNELREGRKTGAGIQPSKNGTTRKTTTVKTVLTVVLVVLKGYFAFFVNNSSHGLRSDTVPHHARLLLVELKKCCPLASCLKQMTHGLILAKIPETIIRCF